jgi:hypothetical protein
VDAPGGAAGTGNAEMPVRSQNNFYDRGVPVKRSRSRSRRPYSGSNGSSSSSHSHNNNSNNYNPNRTFDSSGPEIKIRGSAPHVYEKYLQLARDANSSGDRVMAENYLQHAEHYYRIIAEQQVQQQRYQAQQQQQQQNFQNGNGQRPPGQSDQPYQQQQAGVPSFSIAEQGNEQEEGEEEPAE